MIMITIIIAIITLLLQTVITNSGKQASNKQSLNVLKDKRNRKGQKTNTRKKIKLAKIIKLM